MEQDFFKDFSDAIFQAIEQGIETNAILLNDKHAICREFFIIVNDITNINNNAVKTVPPMILGHKLFLSNFIPDEYDFIVTKVKEDNVPSDLDVIKKYIKIIGHGDNEQLVFKGISSKRNKKDFERIKSLIINE